MSLKKLHVRVYIDGGSRGNPGPAGAGVVIRDTEDGQALHEAGLFLGEATNNVAEYRALLAGMEAAKKFDAAEVEIVSDSQLLVRQMTGLYRVKNEGLKPLHDRAMKLASGFARCSYRHIRREDNTHADRLVNQAINLRQEVSGEDG